MKYRLYFDAILCDRFMSNFMSACGCCDGVGIGQRLSFDTTTYPTKEYIEKMTKVLESTKEEKSLEKYYTCVKHVRTEVIEDEEI